MKRATLLASLWAQKLDLQPGNLWEPAIARLIFAEAQRLGGDANAWAFTEAMFCVRLGLTP